MRESVAMSFKDYGRPIEMVISLKYFGQVLTDSDENWPAVVGNLRKARNICDLLAIIIGGEGDSPRV